MTIGIICTVVLGLVAAYQTWAASQYRAAAEIYQKALHAQRAHALAVVDKLACFVAVAVLPAHSDAAWRGDARQCNAIIHGAVVKANAIKVPE